jgi:hypothetical protein
MRGQVFTDESACVTGVGIDADRQILGKYGDIPVCRCIGDPNRAI